MGIVTTVLDPAPSPTRERPVRLPDVVNRLGSLVGSAEPAVVFLSVARVCVPQLCTSAVAAISEAGERTYTIGNPPTAAAQAMNGPTGVGAVLGFGGIEVTANSVVTEVRGPATVSHPAYEGVLMLTFDHREPTQALLGQLVADRAVAMISLERLNAIAEMHRVHADNLDLALRSNRDIGVALGIIMSRYRLTEAAAFDLLRTSSQDTQRKVRDVALDVARTGQVELSDRVLEVRGGGRSVAGVVVPINDQAPR